MQNFYEEQEAQIYRMKSRKPWQIQTTSPTFQTGLDPSCQLTDQSL